MIVYTLAEAKERLIESIKEMVIVLLILLAIVLVFVNRPPFFYINRVLDQKNHQFGYQICAGDHRWGTTTVCPSGSFQDFSQAEFRLFQLNEYMREQGAMKRWKMVVQQ